MVQDYNPVSRLQTERVPAALHFPALDHHGLAGFIFV